MGGMQNQFYLTLPSNSSMQYYPKNTVANYTTHLPRAIRLDDGDWEMALVEAHYPCSFLSVGNDESIVIYTQPQEETNVDLKALERVMDSNVDVRPVVSAKPKQNFTIKLKTGDYANIQELLDHINTQEHAIAYGVKFTIENSYNKFVEVSMGSDVGKIKLSPTLALQLGFDPNESTLEGESVNKSIRSPNIRLGLPSHMYVYCDLVEPQMVGDTVAPLLKIVNISTTSYVYGLHNSTSFLDPHYVPVMYRSFDSVEIDLRDSTGRHLPFHFGTSCVKLHFRKVALRH